MARFMVGHTEIIDLSKLEMKFYNPNNIEPNSNQFYSFIKDKISNTGQQSYSYIVVLGLFETSTSLYHNLNFHTKSVSLTATQERDLIALTASYIFQLTYNNHVERAIEQDNTLLEEDKKTLKLAVELFRMTATTVCKTIGNPKWIDDCKSPTP